MKSIDWKSKKVCVVDHGMYVHVAIKLADMFGEVLYYTDWACSFPTIEPLLVGEGFPGVKRVKHFWKEAAHCDLFIFTDIYYGDLQAELLRQGKRVWGPRWGEELEIKRWRTNQMLPSLGLPQPKAELITGIPALREFLKKNENIFVKVSGLRGMMETNRCKNYILSENWLDKLEGQLSGVKNIVKFVCFYDIPDAVEVGGDLWSADGQYPEVASFGIEIKDCCLVSCVKEYKEFPEPLSQVLNAFRPVLQDYYYRGFLCPELRVTKDGPFLIDWAARCGSPSSEALMELYGNWPEIFWYGAEGKLVRPEKIANFAIEVIAHAGHSSPEDWNVVQIDDAARKWVKLHLWARIDGVDTICPQEFPLKEFGAVVGIGNTLQEAEAAVKKHCEGVVGDGIEFNLDKIGEGMKEIVKGEEVGIDFGEGAIQNESHE